MLRSIMKRVWSGTTRGTVRRGESVGRATWAARMELLESRRLLSAGDLDSTFNLVGTVVTEAPNASFSSLNAMKLLSGGKILVAGDSDGDFVLARYNSDGSLDTTFGTNGFTLTDLGGTDVALGVAIVSDGKILVSGSTYSVVQQLALGRYSSEGILDTTFGTNGMLISPEVMQMNLGSAMGIQGEKVVIGGTSVSTLAAVRLNADGTFDSGFGTNGVALTGIDNNHGPSDVAVLADGKILLPGTSRGSQDMAVTRLESNGAVDTTFGTDGIAQVDAGGGQMDKATAVGVQSDGKIVIGGWATAGAQTNLALARFTAGGLVDPDFGIGGAVTTLFPSDATIESGRVRDLAIQQDGRIVGIGDAYSPDMDYFALMQVDSNGDLNMDFGDGGTVLTAVEGARSYANATAIQDDGKIVVVGRSDAFLALARYEDEVAGDTTGPSACFQGSNVTVAAGKAYNFSVVYTDSVQMNAASVQSAVVTAHQEGGLTPTVTLLGVQTSADGKSCTASYRLTPPGGSWDYADNGPYFLQVDPLDIMDGAGNALAASELGMFTVNAPFAYLSRGWLVFNGTAGKDTMYLTYRKGYITAALGKQRLYFQSKQVSNILVSALAGNDVVAVGVGIIGLTIDGGDGNDNLTGGNGNDTIKGMVGNDTIRGGNGNDVIDGGTGCDMLYGDAGNDTLYAREKAVDTLDGGAGIDSAKCDKTDVRKDIEKLLK